MKVHFPRLVLPYGLVQIVSLFVVMILFAAPLCAQQPTATPAKPAPQPQSAAPTLDPTFETLLSTDSYKLYGEVRNVGQLMSNGGMGDIVDPIIKLADPPKEFNSIIKFLKTNAEALASSRLLFVTWPARTGIPDAFVAIEFPAAEDAAKFAPKLETFLPGILPPVPVATPEEKPSGQTTPTDVPQQTGARDKKETAAVPAASPSPPAERPAFVLSHKGNLVFISDKAFKFEKLRPASSKSLAEDQNFRVAHDRFSNESVFLYFNVQLEDRTRPQPSPTPMITEAEREQMEREMEAEIEKQQEETRKALEEENNRRAKESPGTEPKIVATLSVQAPPSATPTPTKEQETQMAASSQIGRLLDSIGYGEPQWPEAVGVALALENNDYVIRALLIEPPEAKRLPLPFVPQLISGPALVSDAPSVLPESTEVFVSASIDFRQTYEGMRKQADIRAKAAMRQMPAGGKEPTDPFQEFEKKAGFKVTEDLLPALGNEIALAGSLKLLEGVGPFNIRSRPSAKPAPEAGAKESQEKKESEALPMLLIAVKDREAARRAMPHVLDGLGLGEANLIAQTEKREDVEIVNYSGFFAYAFVGNFLIISQTPSVRRAVDSYLNHQTLVSNTVFRNSRRWEPRQNLGEVYFSPAMMEGYHDAIRKEAGTMDPTMRDFILGLDPTASAITYALSNEGLGTQHEIHLPKNLIITMVAGISSATKNPPPEANEMIAQSALRMISSAESTYQSTTGKGKYGTLDDLVEAKLVNREFLEKYGYRIEVTASDDQFEAVATPREYGKTGKRSFFVDKSGVVRGDDHGGGPATVADNPIQ
ncbi:MAG TPA: hypothetical protein VEM96_09415 [Pyrinomonadaceae bacterium]|nr:hypothetical protein [Pyrinomonadaceae bacterium]